MPTILFECSLHWRCRRHKAPLCATAGIYSRCHQLECSTFASIIMKNRQDLPFAWNPAESWPGRHLNDLSHISESAPLSGSIRTALTEKLRMPLWRNPWNSFNETSTSNSTPIPDSFPTQSFWAQVDFQVFLIFLSESWRNCLTVDRRCQGYFSLLRFFCGCNGTSWLTW